MTSNRSDAEKEKLLAGTTVVNIAQGEVCDVVIDRTGPWGNPFVIGPDGDRAEVIAKFRGWFPKQQHLVDRLEELLGRRLGCHCAPLPCHGDALKEFLGRKIRGLPLNDAD